MWKEREKRNILSVAVESRSSKRPMMSEIRESGIVEQDADVTLFYIVNRIMTRTRTIIPLKSLSRKTEMVPLEVSLSITTSIQEGLRTRGNRIQPVYKLYLAEKN